MRIDGIEYLETAKPPVELSTRQLKLRKNFRKFPILLVHESC